jgi:hypothetical protein
LEQATWAKLMAQISYSQISCGDIGGLLDNNLALRRICFPENMDNSVMVIYREILVKV